VIAERLRPIWRLVNNPWVGVGFLVVAVGFAVWRLTDEWDGIVEAAAAVGALRWGFAFLVLVVATVVSGTTWLLLLTAFGRRVGVRHGMAPVMVGQLGKYVPGSVWTVGIQMRMARRLDVPWRTSLAVGLMFIGWHVMTATALGSAGLALGIVDGPVPPWLAAVVAVVVASASVPWVLNRIGRRLAGDDDPARYSWGLVAVLWGVFVVVWFLFGLGLFLLLAPDAGASADPGANGMGIHGTVVAFALAYAVGVVVVIAPAGVGAREAVLVALLATSVGSAAATAAVLGSRAMLVVADLGVALVAWLLSRSRVPLPEAPTTAEASAASSNSGRGDTGSTPPTA
jgi:glycosyltransferase 2 family protein